MFQSLHHFDIDRLLDQVTAVLDPKGSILLEDFDRSLVGKRIGHLGLSEKTLEGIYHELRYRTNDDVIRFLRRNGIINNPRILTYFSFLASYTADEVSKKLAERGYKSHIVLNQSTNSYKILARRVQIGPNQSKIEYMIK